jgi:hypothetical protein
MAKLIKQRTGADCAIAAVAMVCERSYNEVRLTYGDDGGIGLGKEDILDLMLSLGDYWRVHQPRKRWTVGEWLKHHGRRHRRCLVSILTDFGPHSIAVIDGNILNPSGGDTDLSLWVLFAVVPD